MRYLLGKLDQVLGGVRLILDGQAEIIRLLKKESKTMSQITDSVAALRATVTAVETKDAAILAYVQGVSTLITAAVEAANGDATAAVANINAIAAELATTPDAIVAINANTPAAEPPAPPVEAPPATTP